MPKNKNHFKVRVYQNIAGHQATSSTPYTLAAGERLLYCIGESTEKDTYDFTVRIIRETAATVAYTFKYCGMLNGSRVNCGKDFPFPAYLQSADGVNGMNIVVGPPSGTTLQVYVASGDLQA